ncbi:MAG: hypothetical protein JXR53_01930 [Bacteroidales bacterium]|nr:hypothetical protein [Bacteroidales bacterium]
MDNLAYTYKNDATSGEEGNQLDYVSDSYGFTSQNDVGSQSSGNYTYDEIGNMISDDTEDIDDIDWTIYGKIASIDFGSDNDLEFGYDPMGNRIMKMEDDVAGDAYTFYVRDAQGNIMATYTTVDDANDYVYLDEFHLYGSSRMDIEDINTRMDQIGWSSTRTHTLGLKYFELSNHLGNVQTTISDRKLAVNSGSLLAYYTADVISSQDYYPFGSIMPGRNYNLDEYRFGFQGQEMDNEIYGNGNALSFKYRVHDPRLGRFFSVDPMAFKYPHESPYSYVGYRPLNTIDPWGMDKIEDPNGDTQNAGTGYKQTEDKKYLYGEGLKTKVWDPDYNPNDGTSKRGGYVNYEGSDIDFDEYGKLKGGRYDGQSFNSIETGGDNDLWGNSWSVSKIKYSNSEFQNYAQTLSEDLNRSGKALMTLGTFLGGMNVAGGARSFLKNPKNFIKSLTPWSLMMTYFIYVGFQEQQTAGEMQGILNAYHSLHGDNPEESQGMYMFEIYSHGAVSAPGGMGVTNRLYFYYDISSGMYLGHISVP